MAGVLAINARTIPHSQQRYETVGDWQVVDHRPNGSVLYVDTSDLGDWRMNAAVTVHEIIEALLCVHGNVDQARVTDFDILYENLRQVAHAPECKAFKIVQSEKMRLFGCECVPTEDSEPGDDEHAPYAKQHALATQVEKLLIEGFGLEWDAYNERVESL